MSPGSCTVQDAFRAECMPCSKNTTAPARRRLTRLHDVFPLPPDGSSTLFFHLALMLPARSTMRLAICKHVSGAVSIGRALHLESIVTGYASPGLNLGHLPISDPRLLSASMGIRSQRFFSVEGALYYERDTKFSEPNALNTLYLLPSGQIPATTSSSW